MRWFQLFILLLCLGYAVLIPVSAIYAQPFVPCEGANCNFCHLADMTNRIINWSFSFLAICAVLILAWGGVRLVTSGGNTEARDFAKGILTNVIIGFLIMLASWLIVDTILKGLTENGEGLEVWGSFDVIGCGGQFTPEEVPLDQKADDDEFAPLFEDTTEIGDAVGVVDINTLPGYSGGRGAPPVIAQTAGTITYENNVRLKSYQLDTTVAPYNYNVCPSVTPPAFFKISESGNVRISRNFTVCQLTNCNASQRAGEYVYLDPRAVAGLDRVADAMGQRPHITSGYRSPSYNAGVKGATCSRHMSGKAFDISAGNGFSTAAIERLCKDAGAGWTKQYASWTHCDWR